MAKVVTFQEQLQKEGGLGVPKDFDQLFADDEVSHGLTLAWSETNLSADQCFDTTWVVCFLV